MPAAAAAPAPVVRHGFVIPSIRLTPPDSRPAKSPECPEQDLSNTTLYVPLRTEEIGWEEGGVIWGGKRPVYAYPTVNLYGGDDDHVIGTYRGGPKGYSFFTITDPNFSAESSSDDCEEIAPPPRKAHDEPRPRRETSDEIESDRGSSSSSSSRGRSSSRAPDSASSAPSSSTSSEAALPKTPLPLAPISTEALPKAPITDAICTSSPTNLNEGSIDEALSSAPASVCCSTPGSSAASSRRGSSSSDTDSGADTGATTPASPPCDAAVDKTIADLGAQLETRLSALSRADVDDEESSRPRKTMKLACSLLYGS